ncbi:MAG TPA: AAA domain-containing protein [Clostridiales bacterium]|nr:AAA domain-containing protein [Clostridiales bacterium]
MAQINNIFSFLKDYNELSNPVITEIDKQKWIMRFSDLPQIKELWSIYTVQDFNELKILEIERPTLEPCPAPDKSILDWLEGNWKKLNVENIQYKEVLVKEALNEDDKVDQVEEFFIDDETRKILFDEWIKKRNNWRAVEIPKEQGLTLYNNLFRLYSDMKKESEGVELILGDGHIRWSMADRIIDHPVLLQRVQLEFDSEKPSFIIKCEELKTELYTPMLRIIPTINQKMLSDVLQDIEANAYHIADTANILGLFQRLINVVDEKGKCVEVFENGYNGPMIMSAPTLFLRKRTLGFSVFIEKIIEELKENKDITLPAFFKNMVGNYKEHTDIDVIEDNWNQSGIDQDVLLTLPANNEQLKIIKYLNSYGAVLVQGPPGTGKTHTIANLIGHLLSQGCSVLVTSHTEKALTVLKEKVYKDQYNKDINLQSLCISLLSSNSQKKEMDDAINEIAIKSTSTDLFESKKKIERLENERKELISKSKAKSQELLYIRSLEYKDIIFDNHTISPIDAAKFINTGYGNFDYIPGSTSDDRIGLPLSTENLDFLYHSNQQISLEEDELLRKKLPSLASLWSIDSFRINTENYIKYSKEIEGWKPAFILKKNVEEDTLYELLETATDILDSLANMEVYQLSIIDKTIKDSIYNSFWTAVFEEFDKLLAHYEKYRRLRFDNNYSMPENIITAESIHILDEIISSGKETPVTLFTAVTKPKWKKLRDEITNNGRVIENRADFENVKLIIEYEAQRAQILNKINKLLSEINEAVPLSVDSFEEKAKQYHKKILSSLCWYKKVWSEFTNKLAELCSDKAKFEELCTIDLDCPVESITKLLKVVLLSDLKKRYVAELLSKLANEWTGFAVYLEEYKTYGQPFEELYYAVVEKDANVYTKVYQLLSDILEKKEMYIRRCRLIEQLKIYAPDWTKAIQNREGIHGEHQLPENIEAAWKWRQLSNQIARIDNYDVNAIQKELSYINEQLMQNARKLAYEKAWYEKIKNKTGAQTQAIEGWRTTIKQVGKGTGKTAPALLKKARELMPLCQTAIPVWIMPLNRVAENFDPQKNKFDVVIIDEASQADILALSALYLGKKVIIVGDDEQVSPDTVGIKAEEISALIEQHLQGVPNSHLYNGKTSVYDMAKAAGFKPMMLTEHFRCLPEIIEFSNQLSYNGKIKPLRDASTVNIKPSVVECRVPNAFKTPKKINEVEAEYIASLICACVADENYRGKTIGVISLLGQEQAYEIERLLQVNLDPKEYEKRRIQCGTASQFQGDERDIIFLSIVEGPSEKGGPVRLLSEDGNNDANRKKYNVAASRAKDQMWVVHSLNPEIDLKPDDIRLRLIKHAINPSIDKNEEKLKHAESDFENKVMNILLNKGYKVTPQWNVGAYRIDMVVEDGDKRIALECDGEKWHTLEDLPKDLKRQAILERLGWRFIRIRGSAFYRNPKDIMKWVFEELETYGIRPNYLSDEIDTSDQNSIGSKIIDGIKRHAEQIRREWHGEEVNTEVNNRDRALNVIDINTYVKDRTERENITQMGTQEALYQKEEKQELKVINEDKFNIFGESFKAEQLSFDLPDLNLTNRQLSIEDLNSLNFQRAINKEHTGLKEEQAETSLDEKAKNKPDQELLTEQPNEKDICKLLKRKGYEFVDKRSQGGSLWVIGDEKLGKELKAFAALGFNFSYTSKGGRATGHKPAWFSKNG